MSFLKNAFDEAKKMFDKLKGGASGYVQRRIPFSQAQTQAYSSVADNVSKKINSFLASPGTQRAKAYAETIQPTGIGKIIPGVGGAQTMYKTLAPMRGQVVPAVKEYGKQVGVKDQRAEDVAFGMRGALGITPFRTASDTYEPTTPRQQTAQRIGQAAYGTLLTAPLGGPNYLANIGSRAVQGATLGTGMGMGSNVLTGKPVTQDLGKHALQGVENSWQLAFTNLAADKIAAKWLPNLTSEKTGTVFNLLKEASKSGSASQVKRQLLLNGAKTLFSRAILETPIENTFFTAIDQLGANDKAGFFTQWMKNLPGNLLGNLLYASADVSFRGTYSFNKKQIDEAGQALIKVLKDKRGFIDLSAIVKLSPERGMGLDLRRMGYSADEIKKMTPTDAQEIMTAGKTSTSWLHKPDYKDKGGDKAIRDMNRIVNDIPVKHKVNFFNYFSTPEYVLKKIGLEPQANHLRQAHEGYQTDLKKEIKRVADWMGRVPTKESNVKIFRWLDGKKEVKLNAEELAVAKEIKAYLKGWADRLDLPEDKQISQYITHIFERGKIEKEFDPEIAKKIAEEIPGSVYDPFLMKRTEAGGYIENTWQALSAYVKRGTRKYNMDPALENLKQASDKLDLESQKYIKRLADRINLRPTEIDTLIDNFIKQTPVKYRWTQRPVALKSKQFRQIVYRATLGLNFRSALTNISQGANTYAVLGEKYTTLGYLDLFKKMKNGDLDELYKHHVLDDGFIQDKNINAYKTSLDKMDKGLFYFFETAEKINRGSAYFGAKRKALAEGMEEYDAINYAKKVVRQTQFKFSAIDTPLVLSSDTAKLLAQFQSYGLKQGEFLINMIKKKDLAGLLRYSAATYLFSKTVGKLYGYKWTDAIPTFRASPVIQLASAGKKALSLDEATREEGQEDLKYMAPGLLIPGGTQLRKTIQGLSGESKTKTGRVRYKVGDEPLERIRGAVFGPGGTKAGQEYSQYWNARNKWSKQKQGLEKKMTNAMLKGDGGYLKEHWAELENPKSTVKSALAQAILKNDSEAYTRLVKLASEMGIKKSEIQTAVKNEKYSPVYISKLKYDLARTIIDKDNKKYQELIAEAQKLGIGKKDIEKELKKLRE